MADFEVRALDETTWAGFAELVERHDGVWGGCWCMGFHAEGAELGAPSSVGPGSTSG